MNTVASRPERITYLVANYNNGRFVADCLESLGAQTDPNWLGLVVDDASTDGSVERIRAVVDDRIRLLVNDTNIGYIATLERLIAEATTDIVAILDSDDAVEPEATAELLAAHARNPAASIVYSRFASYDASLATRLGVYGGAIPQGGTAIIDGPLGAILSFRRSAYWRTDGLDPAMLYAQDRDLVYKLEELSPPVFVNRVLYRYRIVMGSQTNDPEKREIGARNARRARQAAVQRRGIGGLSRLGAECMIACDYIAYSHRFNSPVRAVANAIASVGGLVWRKRRRSVG